jgi:hypothetical protein
MIKFVTRLVCEFFTSICTAIVKTFEFDYNTLTISTFSLVYVVVQNTFSHDKLWRHLHVKFFYGLLWFLVTLLQSKMKANIKRSSFHNF